MYPYIRFKYFYDKWNKQSLFNVLKEFALKTKYNNEYPMLSSTVNGIEPRIGKVSGKDNIGYKIIDIDDLVISPQNLWLGNININFKYRGIVSPSYHTFKVINASPVFLNYFLKQPYFIYQFNVVSTQGASVVRRNLNIEEFLKIAHYFPSIKEQESIGLFVYTIDKLIENQKRKIFLINLFKRGLLQKLFIDNIYYNKFPQIRFKGFNDAWEKVS